MENKWAEEIKIMCYAHDTVIIAKDEDNLHRLLFRLEQVARRFNKQISV